MGQDGEDRENGDSGLTVSRGGGDLRSFRREIRTALRYERGLFVKALVALAVVALIAVTRTVYSM
jgi:hydroxypyruvate isomerase